MGLSSLPQCGRKKASKKRVNAGLLRRPSSGAEHNGRPWEAYKASGGGAPVVRPCVRSNEDRAMTGSLAGQPRARGLPLQDHRSGILRRVEPSPQSPPAEGELQLRLRPATSTFAEAG